MAKSVTFEAPCPACGSLIKHCVTKTRIGPTPEPAEYEITDDASVIKSLFTPKTVTPPHADGKCADCGKPSTLQSDGVELCDKCNRKRSKVEDTDEE